MAVALAGLRDAADHFQALRTLVLELPVLQHESVHDAVVVLVARADAAEGGDLVALLLAEFPDFARLLEYAAGDVIVERRHVVAGHGGIGNPLPFRAPRLPDLAPLAIEKHQQMLAGGLDAVFAQREFRRRLALSQQADAVAQALGEALDVQVSRLGGVRAVALRTEVAFQVDHERRDVLALGRLLRHIHLLGPALEEKGDEGELPLAELVRVSHAEQQRAQIGDARRRVVDVAVEVVLDRVIGNAQFLRHGVALMQLAPDARRDLPVGAVAVKHLEPRIRERPLADEPALFTYSGLPRNDRFHAAQVAQVHLLPQRERVVEHRVLAFGHRQRAIGEAPRLLDFHELHRLAQRLQRRQAVGCAGAIAVEFLDLLQQLLLGGGHVRERHVLEP